MSDHRIVRVPADGPLLRTGGDAIELIYGVEDAEWIALPVEQSTALRDLDELA